VKIYCATGNAGKLREFELAARAFGIQVESVPAFRDLPACAENGSTFEENAILKASHYAPYAPGCVFADDSGLEVDALHGAPGIYSARYAGEGARDEENNRLLLSRLQGRADRKARFVCVIAIAEGERILRTFHGAVEGEVAHEPRGRGGFGYDPLFYHEPFGCTFGEIAVERKMEVSHRGQALRAMFRWLQNRNNAA
jgi:XTP/dITP diphosphohydrolase